MSCWKCGDKDDTWGSGYCYYCYSDEEDEEQRRRDEEE
jgi:NMD protein affecting ribosome stability and mRNA decay